MKSALEAKIEESKARIAAMQARLASKAAPAPPVALAVPGAPAIATASGEYVAGNPIKRLASATLPHSKANDFEGQCESFWRVCGDGMKTPSDKVVVTATSPLAEAPCPAKATERTPAPTEMETPRTEDPDHVEVEETTGHRDTTPPVEETGDGYGTPASLSNTASKSKFDATYHKIRRYCDPSKKKVTASKECMELWKTDEGREKLRSLLQEHGDFKTVELQLSRWSKRVQSDDKKGRWVTKQYLMDEEKYTKIMADNSFEWAAARGLVRKNPVHGEDEARLILEESFGAHNERGESHSVTGTGECEDPDGLLFSSDLIPDDEFGSKPADGHDHRAVVAAAANASSGSKQLIFPTLQKNDSPFTILPNFITCLGKKIDQAVVVQEKLENMGVPRATEMAGHIKNLVETLNAKYNTLNDKQAEYLTTEDARSMDEKKKNLMELFSSCTKNDVALNNLLCRSRNIKAASTSSASKGKSNKGGTRRKRLRRMTKRTMTKRTSRLMTKRTSRSLGERLRQRLMRHQLNPPPGLRKPKRGEELSDLP